eukprot:TRINITY_DN1496_c0_g1_i1.p1 TRINITY_DN1496_c0_g1~~TRINITY_DN1496_c0_g1_i1.p1  ORF type:complete len:1748 (-),score=597.92 TRINITY_DN1496_c0_g1_i1:92-4636(-)
MEISEEGQTTNIDGKEWILVIEKKYRIKLLPKNSNGDLIDYIEGFEYSLSGSDNIKIVSINHSQSFAIIETIGKGKGKINASIIKNNKNELSPSITAQHEIDVTEPIKASPSELNLLYIPGADIHKSLISVIGGSGQYEWTSDNQHASVDKNGVVSAHTLGKSIITVFDSKNKKNFATITVFVNEIGSIKLNQNSSEVLVGGSILSVASILDVKGNQFSSCQRIPLRWSVGKAFSMSSEAASSGNQCFAKIFVAENQGSATITAEVPGLPKIKGESLIFSHPPLSLASSSEILLTVGSSAESKFIGGPVPWPQDKSLFIVRAQANTQSKDAVIVSTRVNYSPFEVYVLATCRLHGTHSISVVTSNKVHPGNPTPVFSTASFNVECRPPGSLEVSVQGDSTSELPNCSGVGVLFPEGVSSSVMRVGSLRSVSARILSDDGRKFTNHSSLVLEWRSSSPSVAEWKGPSTLTTSSTTTANSLLEKTLVMGRGTGSTEVQVLVSRYDKAYLSAAGNAPIPVVSFTNLSKKSLIQTTTEISLTTEKTRLFNHKSESTIVRGVGGTGRFSFTLNNEKVARIETIGNDAVRVFPLSSGTVRIVASDLCLPEISPASIPVMISDVSSVHLEVPRVVSVTDSELPATFTITDTEGNNLEEHWISLLEPQLVVEGGSAVLPQNKLPSSGSFMIKCVEPGLVATRVSIQTTSVRFDSNPVHVEVYAPFHVSPREVTVSLGSKAMFTLSGGPQINKVKSSLTSNASSVAEPILSGNSLQVIALSGGVASIRVNLVDPSNPSTIYGSDTVTVTVSLLTGIRLHSTIHELIVGEKSMLKLRVEGLGGESPIEITRNLGIRLQWSLDNQKVARLVNVYHESGMAPNDDLPLGLLVEALQPGTVTITAKVSSSDNSIFSKAYSHMTASFVVTVSEKFQITSPLVLHMMPGAESTITTNRDVEKERVGSRIIFRALGSDCGKENLPAEVSDRGIIRAKSVGSMLVAISLSGSSETLNIVTVHVAEPMHLNAIPVDFKSRELAQGQSLLVRVIFRSQSGVELISPSMPLQATSDKKDILQIKRNESDSRLFTILGETLGESVVRFSSDAHPQLDDYILIKVGSDISPLSPLVHVGGTINFRLWSDPQGKLRSGRWSSDNEKVIRINPDTGVAQAISEGVCTVSHKTSNGGDVSLTSVSVVKAAEIVEEAQTALDSARGISLLIKSQGGASLLDSQEIQNNLMISCDILPFGNEKIVLAKASYVHSDKSRGHECVVTLQNPLPLLNVKFPEITLVATVKDSKGSQLARTEIPVLFDPGFALAESEVILSRDHPSQRLFVNYATGAFSMTSSDPSRVSVSHVPVNNPFVECFDVSLVNPSQHSKVDGIKLFLSDPAKSKTQILPVLSSRSSSSSSTSSTPSTLSSSTTTTHNNPTITPEDVGPVRILSDGRATAVPWRLIVVMIAAAVALWFAFGHKQVPEFTPLQLTPKNANNNATASTTQAQTPAAPASTTRTPSRMTPIASGSTKSASIIN